MTAHCLSSHSCVCVCVCVCVNLTFFVEGNKGYSFKWRYHRTKRLLNNTPVQLNAFLHATTERRYISFSSFTGNSNAPLRIVFSPSPTYHCIKQWASRTCINTAGCQICAGLDSMHTSQELKSTSSDSSTVSDWVPKLRHEMRHKWYINDHTIPKASENCGGPTAGQMTETCVINKSNVKVTWQTYLDE